MNNLVARLRERMIPNWVHATGDVPKSKGYQYDALCQEAAYEIERLEAQNIYILQSLAKLDRDLTTLRNMLADLKKALQS